MPLEPLADKWRAFNWHVIEVGGHDFLALNQVVEEAQAIHEKPTVIIAHTIKGKGISFMENNNLWHYRAPQGEEYKKALKELTS